MIKVGRVISLDRGYPLVKTADGEFRGQHSIDLVKNSGLRSVVGDVVDVDFPEAQETPLITAIHQRGHSLVRRTLVESRSVGSGKHDEQILASNIDIVFVVSALGSRHVDLNYLERQLVMAHDSGAEVVIVLSKADLAKHLDADLAAVREVAPGSEVIAESATGGEGIARIRELVCCGKFAVLLGRSGVGKSSLINALAGEVLQHTKEVRGKDRAGRHATVGRKMIFIGDGDAGGVPNSSSAKGFRAADAATDFGAYDDASAGSSAADAREASATTAVASDSSAIIDTPGLRSIGLYDARAGLAATFAEIDKLSESCHYRDCSHSTEPNCAVRAALQNGQLSRRRLNNYIEIAREVQG